jgi:hypothetical protein
MGNQPNGVSKMKAPNKVMYQGVLYLKVAQDDEGGEEKKEEKPAPKEEKEQEKQLKELKAQLVKKQRVLRRFAEQNEINLDWSGPIDSGVTGVVIGKKLDNTYEDSGEDSEMILIMKSPKGQFRVNVATLLAMACMGKMV